MSKDTTLEEVGIIPTSLGHLPRLERFCGGKDCIPSKERIDKHNARKANYLIGTIYIRRVTEVGYERNKNL